MTKPEVGKGLKRTDWAELHVEDLLGLPFIKECVYRSPRAPGKAEPREVVDFLIIQEPIRLLISQKCQDKPETRDAEKTTRWARKEAKNALSQLYGALRKGPGREMWCDHPRRGRVTFADGLPPIDHAIVIVETLYEVDLEPEAAALPLELSGVPVTYLSVNDFLNLAWELRTVPELSEYLHARRILPPNELRIIGNEQLLYHAYLVGDGKFAHGLSRQKAERIISEEGQTLANKLASKKSSDEYSYLMEQVAHELAHRSTEIPESLQHRYEPLDARKGYLAMQSVIGNLRLAERVTVGRAFQGVIDDMESQSKGLTFKALHLDSSPEIVFVLGATKGWSIEEVSRCIDPIAIAAAAEYQKKQALVILDRGAESFEVCLVNKTGPFSDEEIQAGKKLFGKLRMTSTAMVPFTG